MILEILKLKKKPIQSNLLESGTFVPKEYWTRKAPIHSIPNTRINHLRLNLKTNVIENSTVIYDFSGRQRYRIDWTNHGRMDHSNPHLHEIIWGYKYSPEKGYEIRWNLKK